MLSLGTGTATDLCMGIGTATDVCMDTWLGLQLDLMTEVGNIPVSYSD